LAIGSDMSRLKFKPCLRGSLWTFDEAIAYIFETNNAYPKLSIYYVQRILNKFTKIEIILKY
jgi:hypothetical protein